jgi:cation:H+ antiporter
MPLSLNSKRYLMIGGVVLLAIPCLLVETGLFHTGPGTEALVFGIGLLGASFILSWAAEIVQKDISQGFALALLAFIAVLPEYAVAAVFAWKAGHNTAYYAPLALSNMTGANRLLIGLGWPTVLVLYFLRSRKPFLQLTKEHGTEVFYLSCTTGYAIFIPFKGYLSLIDAAVLLLIFFTYLYRTTRSDVEEPDLIGPSALIGSFRPAYRRLWTVLFFIFSGVIIYLSAEPFADSLVAFGRSSGIDEFLLVQWLAPLASEAPEFLVASVWTLRGQAPAAMGALISSKINQWGLLVGTLPIVFSIASGRLGALPLDLRTEHEIWLTAGQSIFAIAILANLRISWYGAIALVILFMSQFIIPEIRMEVFWIYLVLGAIILMRDRRFLPGIISTGVTFRSPR